MIYWVGFYDKHQKYKEYYKRTMCLLLLLKISAVLILFCQTGKHVFISQIRVTIYTAQKLDTKGNPRNTPPIHKYGNANTASVCY